MHASCTQLCLFAYGWVHWAWELQSRSHSIQVFRAVQTALPPLEGSLCGLCTGMKRAHLGVCSSCSASSPLKHSTVSTLLLRTAQADPALTGGRQNTRLSCPTGFAANTPHAAGSDTNGKIPAQEMALRLADSVSDTAQRIGAVNTLIRQPDGSLAAHNTDWTAAIGAIEAGLAGPKSQQGGEILLSYLIVHVRLCAWVVTGESSLSMASMAGRPGPIVTHHPSGFSLVLTSSCCMHVAEADQCLLLQEVRMRRRLQASIRKLHHCMASTWWSWEQGVPLAPLSLGPCPRAARSPLPTGAGHTTELHACLFRPLLLLAVRHLICSPSTSAHAEGSGEVTAVYAYQLSPCQNECNHLAQPAVCSLHCCRTSAGRAHA